MSRRSLLLDRQDCNSAKDADSDSLIANALGLLPPPALPTLRARKPLRLHTPSLSPWLTDDHHNATKDQVQATAAPLTPPPPMILPVDLLMHVRQFQGHVCA
jgi:hypothetical protein